MAPKVALSHQAYVGILLHTAKHPHQPVNGVLLGSAWQDEISVQRTIPLLHHWTSLSPMMEIGLDLATTYASQAGLQVVGYYQASPGLHDTALGPVGEKLLSKLRQTVPGAVALQVFLDQLASKLSADAPGVSVIPSGQIILQSKKSPARATELIASGLQTKFADFDDHLEDVALDWLNNPECTDKEFAA